MWSTAIETWHLTVNAGLVETPVDAQAVLLLLHAPPALAAAQRAGEQGRHGVGTLAAGARAQLHAAVARHALAQRAQARAACLIARARVPRMQAVPPARPHPTRNTWGQVRD